MAPSALPVYAQPAVGTWNIRWLQHATVLLLLALCFLGDNVLHYFGYVMGPEATSPITKVHPLTYLVFIILGFNFLLFDFSLLRALFSSRPARVYLLALLALFLSLIASGTANAVGYIFDTLVMPVLILAYLRSIPADIAARAPHYALLLILLNSAGAIAERVLSTNFFPLRPNLFDDVFRASSLLGHPLNNALITFVFILFVLVVELPTIRKWFYLLTMLTALICYGARGSLYVSVLAIFLLYLLPVFFSHRAYYQQVNKFGVGILVALSAVAIGYLVLFTPFGERLLNASFYDDNSAGARVEVLNLLDFKHPSEYLWAKPQERIDYQQHVFGIYIIENFLIVWLLKFGLIFASLLTGALVLFLYQTNRIAAWPSAMLTVALFMATAATNNSLASSTSAVVLFVILFAVPTRRYRFAL